MEWVAAIIIFVCVGVGTYYQDCTDKIDAPVEQIAEEILDTYQIHTDFSAAKKKKLLEQQAAQAAQPTVAVENKEVK